MPQQQKLPRPRSRAHGHHACLEEGERSPWARRSVALSGQANTRGGRPRFQLEAGPPCSRWALSVAAHARRGRVEPQPCGLLGAPQSSQQAHRRPLGKPLANVQGPRGWLDLPKPKHHGTREPASLGAIPHLRTAGIPTAGVESGRPAPSASAPGADRRYPLHQRDQRLTVVQVRSRDSDGQGQTGPLSDQMDLRAVLAPATGLRPVSSLSFQRPHVQRVDRGPRPVQLAAGAELVEDQAVEFGPHSGLGPLGESPVSRRSRRTERRGRQLLPRAAGQHLPGHRAGAGRRFEAVTEPPAPPAGTTPTTRPAPGDLVDHESAQKRPRLRGAHLP